MICSPTQARHRLPELRAGADLSAGGLWQATAARLNADLGMLLTVAAPFTLLVDVAVSLLGPPPPLKLADITPQVMLWNSLVPIVVGTIAALAVSRLAGRPGTTPRDALAAAFALFPAYLLAFLAYGLIGGFGLLLFLLPGLYIAARMLPLAAVAALEGGSAGTMLRRTWALTEGHGANLLWFLTIATFAAVFGLLLAGAVAGAVASVATLLGAEPLGHFASAALGGFYAMLVSVAFAVAGVIVRERLL